jgi:UDP:flavonoid glycosyltransferase YjiC (YdhE family)
VTIAFYISGHGFGHASRQVEVINAIAAARPDVRFVLRTAVSADLLARTLRAPYELRAAPCDSGIAQRSSVEHDDVRTVEDALAFHRDWPARISREAAALAPDSPSVIVGDVPPLAFEVARALGVPSVAIANFTWDWIYETYPGFERAAEVLALVRAGYRHASMALRLPLSAGFEQLADVRPIPFIARQPGHARADTRAHFGIDPDRPAVLLSFGGYGLPLVDLGRVDCLGDWTIVTTDRVSGAATTPPPRRLVRIDERAFAASPFRYEDLVASVDVVLTKPGYGIIADCIAAGVAMLYTSRGSFREYDLLVAALPRYLRSRFISLEDLFAGRWRAALDALLLEPPPPERPPTDGARIAAAAVLDRAG